jgi:hypothetical protein
VVQVLAMIVSQDQLVAPEAARLYRVRIPNGNIAFVTPGTSSRRSGPRLSSTPCLTKWSYGRRSLSAARPASLVRKRSRRERRWASPARAKRVATLPTTPTEGHRPVTPVPPSCHTTARPTLGRSGRAWWHCTG